jgi:shikimate kinase
VKRAIFLVGFMGSGKSTVGASLARMLGWRFVDTDRSIEEEDGREIAVIFGESGEEYFRDMERRIVRHTPGVSPVVVAIGGGAFNDAGLREWMKSEGHTVWLDVPLEELKARVGEGGNRPLWSGEGAIEKLHEQRRGSYALAEHRIDASTGTPGEIAERILELLGG